MIALGLGGTPPVPGGERPATPPAAGAGSTPPFGEFFQHLLGRQFRQAAHGDGDTGPDGRPAGRARRADTHDAAADSGGPAPAAPSDADTAIVPGFVDPGLWFDTSARPATPPPAVPDPGGPGPAEADRLAPPHLSSAGEAGAASSTRPGWGPVGASRQSGLPVAPPAATAAQAPGAPGAEPAAVPFEVDGDSASAPPAPPPQTPVWSAGIAGREFQRRSDDPGVARAEQVGTRHLEAQRRLSAWLARAESPSPAAGTAPNGEPVASDVRATMVPAPNRDTGIPPSAPWPGRAPVGEAQADGRAASARAAQIQPGADARPIPGTSPGRTTTVTPSPGQAPPSGHVSHTPTPIARAAAGRADTAATTRGDAAATSRRAADTPVSAPSLAGVEATAAAEPPAGTGSPASTSWSATANASDAIRRAERAGLGPEAPRAAETGVPGPGRAPNAEAAPADEVGAHPRQSADQPREVAISSREIRNQSRDAGTPPREIGPPAREAGSPSREIGSPARELASEPRDAGDPRHEAALSPRGVRPADERARANAASQHAVPTPALFRAAAGTTVPDDGPQPLRPGGSMPGAPETTAAHAGAARAADPGRPAFPHLTLVTAAPPQADSGPFVVQAAAPPPPAAPPDVEFPDQIVQSLRLQMTSGGGEARLQLRPEYLGELTVRVVVERGVVTAQLEAQTPAVREWIERHEVSLRQALGEHGLTLDELIVSDKPANDAARERPSQHPREERDADEPSSRSRRRHAEGDGPRFEVVV